MEILFFSEIFPPILAIIILRRTIILINRHDVCMWMWMNSTIRMVQCFFHKNRFQPSKSHRCCGSLCACVCRMTWIAKLSITFDTLYLFLGHWAQSTHTHTTNAQFHSSRISNNINLTNFWSYIPKSGRSNRHRKRGLQRCWIFGEHFNVVKVFRLKDFTVFPIRHFANVPNVRIRPFFSVHQPAALTIDFIYSKVTSMNGSQEWRTK